MIKSPRDLQYHTLYIVHYYFQKFTMYSFTVTYPRPWVVLSSGHGSPLFLNPPATTDCTGI